MKVPREGLEQTLRQFYDYMDEWLSAYSAGGPLSLDRDADYSESITVNGVQMVVKAWFMPSAKQAFVQFVAFGTASGQISSTFPTLPYQPDFGPLATQALFIPINEFTPGNPVDGANPVGAMVINQTGQVIIDINNGAALNNGSADSRWLKLR